MKILKIQRLALVGLVAATMTAYAGNNPAPLGFELGVTTRTTVQTSLRGKTGVVEKGINKFSGGVVIEARGSNFDADGLQQATLIFDRQEILVAVVLQFPKGFGNQNTAKVADLLGKNYQLVRRNIPSVGDATARYKQGTSAIQLDAPHMSFECSVSYMTAEFEQAYKQAVARDKSERESTTRRNL